MNYDKHQALYESLVEEYRTMFFRMDDTARALWFTVCDESVILSFDVGDGESPMQAEERHAVKLYAIAAALAGLPCASKERGTIDDLRKMAGEIYIRHEKKNQPEKTVCIADDPYDQALKELRAEGKI